MTAFAFDLAPDRLAIASDTVIYSTGSTARVVGFASKVFVLPRLRFVLCGRGIVEIAAEVHRRLAVAPIATFGEAVEMMPGLLRAATDEWAAANGLEDPGQRQVFEALYAGFDREAGRARLFSAWNYEGFEAHELPPGCGCGVIPVLPSELRPDIAGLPLRDRLLAGIRAAARYFASDPERAKGAVIGGEIELTTITASEIACRPIGFLPVEIPDPAACPDIGAGDPLSGLVRVADLKVAHAQPAPPVNRPQVSRPPRGRSHHPVNLTGIGAGFGAGVTLNSLLGGNKLTGTIGSGVGSLAGTAIGSLFGPAGALAGGIIGGAAGGGFGGPLGRDTTTISTGRISLP